MNTTTAGRLTDRAKANGHHVSKMMRTGGLVEGELAVDVTTSRGDIVTVAFDADGVVRGVYCDGIALTHRQTLMILR